MQLSRPEMVSHPQFGHIVGRKNVCASPSSIISALSILPGTKPSYIVCHAIVDLVVAHIIRGIDKANRIGQERFVIDTLFLYLKPDIRDDIVIVFGDPDDACFRGSDEFILYGVSRCGQ